MDNKGLQVKARREALGMNIIDLARAAGVSRDTLSDLETGVKNYTQKTLIKVQRALDAAELEAGKASPTIERAASDSDLIEFEITGDPGMRIVVRGPIADHETLVGDVARLIREIRANPDNSGSAAHGTDE